MLRRVSERAAALGLCVTRGRRSGCAALRPWSLLEDDSGPLPKPQAQIPMVLGRKALLLHFLEIAAAELPIFLAKIWGSRFHEVFLIHRDFASNSETYRDRTRCRAFQASISLPRTGVSDGGDCYCLVASLKDLSLGNNFRLRLGCFASTRRFYSVEAAVGVQTRTMSSAASTISCRSSNCARIPSLFVLDGNQQSRYHSQNSEQRRQSSID